MEVRKILELDTRAQKKKKKKFKKSRRVLPDALLEKQWSNNQEPVVGS